MADSIEIPVFYQEEEWITREGEKIMVADMTRDHVRHLLVFLERKMDDLAFADSLYSARMPLPSEDTIAFLDVMAGIDRQAALKNQSVETWFESLPLIKALRARLAEFGEIDPDDVSGFLDV